MNTERVSQQLRLPSDLKAWIAEQAKKNGRSSNSEIVQRLQELRARCAENVQQ